MTTISPLTFNTLRLIRSDKIGIKTFCDLIKIFGNPTQAVNYLKVQNYKHNKITLAPKEEIEKEILATLNYNAKIISCFDPEYPELLKQTHNYPPIIIAKGNVELLKKNKISIVGSRNASVNGTLLAYQVAQELKNYVICSGLARGIDTSAHKGSISHGTIAVMAGGINNIYPPENKDLYDQIISDGLLITESSFNTIPKPQHFPNRNRIISGLSLAIIVIEANIKSGSLITARFALEQNREIFAVPGFPLDQRYSGTNKLIKDGAHLFESTQDVISTLEMFKPKTTKIPPEPLLDQQNDRIEIDDTAKIKKEVLSALSNTPTHFDNLARILQFPRKLLHLALVELELEGNIKRIGLDSFVIIL